MILDTFDRLSIYKSLNPQIEAVINFCRGKDLSSLAEGRVDINQDCFAIPMTMAMRKTEDAQIETHRSYIDIQLVLKGVEKMGYRPLSSLSESEGYSEDKDLEFWKDPCENLITVEEGQFALFFPEDGHLPLIGEGEIQKIVFKLKV